MPKEWSDLIEKTVRHFTRRYGVEEIKKRYFEIWNEPNHQGFFTESQHIEKYFELYDSAAYAIKSVCADYRVGGPATASMGWIPEMIAHCGENNVPLDFVSSHNYPGKVAFDPDGTRQVYLMPLDELTDGFCEKGSFCHQNGYPFLITEWSPSSSPRDSVHDSYVSAPLILRVIKQCEGSVDMLSYWTYTDIFEETGIPPQPFHGGFGLLSVNPYPSLLIMPIRSCTSWAKPSAIATMKIHTSAKKMARCKFFSGIMFIRKTKTPPIENILQGPSLHQRSKTQKLRSADWRQERFTP